MFQPKKCSIPTVYCGTQQKIPKKLTDNTRYVRRGTPYECMKKGYGAGLNSQRIKDLPSNSLQRIKYVGETFESNFKKKKIFNTDILILFSSKLSKSALKGLLEGVFSKKGKNMVVDKRAYNSTLIFLYNNGVYANLPQCDLIKI